MTLLVRIDSSKDVDGIPVTRHMIEPSCSWGMNSLPRNGKSPNASTSATEAVITTARLADRARSSSGR